MKVIVTLDYWDGVRSKSSKPVELEDVIGHLKFALNERGVASLTITRCDGLKRLAEATNEGVK